MNEVNRFIKDTEATLEVLYDNGVFHRRTVEKALELIKQLQAEVNEFGLENAAQQQVIERLQAENEEAHGRNLIYSARVEVKKERINQLQAEVEQLRHAIIVCRDINDSGETYNVSNADAAQALANLFSLVDV